MEAAKRTSSSHSSSGWGFSSSRGPSALKLAASLSVRCTFIYLRLARPPAYEAEWTFRYKDLRLLTKVTLPLVLIANVLLLVPPVVAAGQQSTLSAGLSRLSGTDNSSHIEYVRLFLRGTLVTSPGSSSPVPVDSFAQASAMVTTSGST